MSTRIRKLRRVIWAALALSMLVPSVASHRPVWAGVRTVSLQERLEKGLRARRPQEFAFIAKVSKLVEAKVIPRKMVDATFFWARRKRRWPYQYFEFGMRRQAARMKIAI